MGSYYGNIFSWGFGGGFVMILFWVAVVVLIVWVVKEIGGKNSQDQTRYSKSALDILEERYAKGEIDKEEYETKKRDLNR